MSSILPTHRVDAALAADGQRTVLTMERELSHPIDAVWAALTKADEVVTWAPYRPDRDLDTTGAVQLAHNADQPDVPEAVGGAVLVVEPPRRLVLRWGDDDLTYELTPTASGTLLQFTHVFDDRAYAPDYAAGWHLCWSALTVHLDGGDVPPVHGDNAKAHGWDRLRQEYDALLA